MTVMVTGASGVVGRATVKALLARDEVRATVRRSSGATYLRQLGAKVAVRDIDSPDALSEILAGCSMRTTAACSGLWTRRGIRA